MAKVSVLTVSARNDWEQLAIESLKRQTYQDFEWIVVHENPDSLDILPAEVIKAPLARRNNNLNASNNEGIRHCNGDYIVFYQDWIELESDCIEKLLDLTDHQTFVTTLTRNADGKDDMRYTGADCPRPCLPEEWEENVAIAPKQVFYELGGYDEEYDWGWAWDNVNIAERASLLGYKFILDESNRPQLHPHDRIERSHNLEPNGERHAQTMRDIKSGLRPLHNTYLL